MNPLRTAKNIKNSRSSDFETGFMRRYMVQYNGGENTEEIMLGVISW